MVERSFGTAKLTPAVRQRLADLAAEALSNDSGEQVQSIGSEERVIETESGEVKWDEPKASLWGIWERPFKHLEFVPILDFIHALAYVYAAADCRSLPATSNRR